MRYVLVILLLLTPVYGHDHKRPDLEPWFKELKSKKSLCCDGRDALHLEDPDWQNENGHYRVKLPFDKDGNVILDNEDLPPSASWEWVDVPDDAVIDEPNQVGHALVWPIPGNNRSIRCFMPGSMS